MAIRKTNRRTTSLKFKEEVTVFKNKTRNSLDDIDIVAIQEWINSKEDINLFSSLRAIAVLCGIVDGLDELFFDLAKELPNKLSLEDLKMETVYDSLKEIDKSKLSPFDYIKSLQTIIESTDQSKRFIETFSDNLLKENLEILSKKFKLIPQEDYNELLKGKGLPVLSSKSNIKSEYQELLEYANSISFQRPFLRSKHEKIS